MRLLPFVTTQSNTYSYVDCCNNFAIGIEKHEDYAVFYLMMKVGSWVGFGFGDSMTCVDMVSFEAKKDFSVSVKDYWSNGPYYPGRDTTENYVQPEPTDIQISYDKNYVQFQSWRLLDTEDECDFVIPLDESFVMTWAGCPISQGMNYHGHNYGWLDVTVPSTEGTPASIVAQDRP